MNYRKLGNTGLDVSPLALGCMSFGEPTAGVHNWTLGLEDARPIVKMAVEAGINFFDTANGYSGGSSEEILGRLLKEMIPRDEVVIATKVYAPMRTGPNAFGLSRKAIMHEVDQSLSRLGTDFIDLYQIHRFDPTTPLEETLEALNDLVRSGKVRYLGASSMNAWQFSKAVHLQRQHGWSQFVTMQDYYNLVYREEEREMHPLCADLGVGVIPWSPLARGRLSRVPGTTTERTSDDKFGDALTKSEENDHLIIDTVRQIAEERELSMSQVALAWVSAQDIISAPIIGARKESHLSDALASLEVTLTREECARLEDPYLPHEVTGM
jgi:aryl-alcohol dehydrogenase-like predicted oxidoreductase